MKRIAFAGLVFLVAPLSDCHQSPSTNVSSPQPALAGEIAIVTSIINLSLHPLRFDGRLVHVRARAVGGWEGDNFLSDPSVPFDPPYGNPAVWYYSKPDRPPIVYGHKLPGDHPAVSTYIGYFHYVPDERSRIKDVFDPGPFQLEVIGVSNLDLEIQ